MRRIILCSLAFCLPQFAGTAPLPLNIGVGEDASLFRAYSEAQIRCAYALADITLNLQYLPTERSIEMLKRGKLDADLLRINQLPTKGKPYIAVPTPVFRVERWIYYRSDIEGFTLEHIEKFRLITLLGSRYYDRYLNGKYQLAERANAPRDAIHMLNAKRGDYFIWTEDGEALMRELPPGHRIKAQSYPAEAPLALVTFLHKRHEDKLKRIDAAYQRAFVDGECPRNVNSPSASPSASQP